MEITTRNINTTTISTKELRAATRFYANQLMSARLVKNLKIIITMKEIDCKAIMEWVDKPTRPREFKITLNSKYKKRQTLLSLAHEMTHVKQYAKGELCDETLRSPLRWNKRAVDEAKVDYWDLPYEIDARGREEGLYYRYLDSLPQYKVVLSEV